MEKPFNWKNLPQIAKSELIHQKTTPFGLYRNGQPDKPNSTHLPMSNFLSNKQKCWKNNQKLKFIIFIHQFRKMNKRKVNWVFYRAMSQFIKSRNPNQCRIYDMKLIEKFQTYSNFLTQCSLFVPNLHQKIQAANLELDRICQQFPEISRKKDLQTQKATKQKREISQSRNLAHISLQSMQLRQKQEKIDNIKTAEDYEKDYERPKFFYPVVRKKNQTTVEYTGFSNFQGVSSGQPNFQGFSRPNKIKKQLPCFDEQEPIIKIPKNERKPFFEENSENLQHFIRMCREINRPSPFFQQQPKLISERLQVFGSEHKQNTLKRCEFLFKQWRENVKKILEEPYSQVLSKLEMEEAIKVLVKNEKNC